MPPQARLLSERELNGILKQAIGVCAYKEQHYNRVIDDATVGFENALLKGHATYNRLKQLCPTNSSAVVRRRRSSHSHSNPCSGCVPWESASVSELKKLLGEIGLNQTGKKSQLVERLKDYYKSDYQMSPPSKKEGEGAEENEFEEGITVNLPSIT